MAFFKRKESENSRTLVNVEDVYVASTAITSSYNDGTGCGLRCVTWYFLAKFENNDYHNSINVINANSSQLKIL